MQIVIIANGESLSSAVDLGAERAAAIEPPATLAATSARVIFYGSLDGSNYEIIEDEDSTRFAVTVGTTNATVHPLPPTTFYPFRWIKIQVMTSDEDTAVAQDAAKTFLIGTARFTG